MSNEMGPGVGMSDDYRNRYLNHLAVASLDELESESQTMKVWGWSDSTKLAALFGPAVMVTDGVTAERVKLAAAILTWAEREKMCNAELVERDVRAQIARNIAASMA